MSKTSFGAELELGTVTEQDAEPAGDDDADVTRLAPLAADLRPNVGRPAPAGLPDHQADGEISELDEIRRDPGELDDLVRCVEVPTNDLRHEI